MHFNKQIFAEKQIQTGKEANYNNKYAQTSKEKTIWKIQNFLQVWLQCQFFGAWSARVKSVFEPCGPLRESLSQFP